MLIVDFLKWWYTRGWGLFARKLIDKLRNAADFFSISQLIKTLFAPLRQISAQRTDASDPASMLANFFDRLLSRCIGAIVRLGILFFGTIAIIVEAALSLILVLIWPLIPLIPIACIVLCVMEVRL